MAYNEKNENLSRKLKRERQERREKREAKQDRIRKILLKNKESELPGTNLMGHRIKEM